MRDVVLCDPVRTAVGRYGGGLADVDATELGTSVVRALLARNNLDGSQIDELILGHCYPSAESPAIGRTIALDSNLPVEVTGIQIDRRCGSGLQAVIYAAMQVQSEASDVIIAGGVESMSNAVHYSTAMRRGARLGDSPMYDSLTRARTTAGGKSHPVPGGMIETAENLRREFSISREQQDRFALSSHERAASAQRDGLFDSEIVPITVTSRAESTIFARDEHVRVDLNYEDLAKLPALLRSEDPDATVTAGNASGQNDAAAMTIVTDFEHAEQLGLRPVVRLLSWGLGGVEPAMMGLGPLPATDKALAMANLELVDMDLIELNEAFAAQVLACTRVWGFGEDDFTRLNVNGSGISLGHPIGATGARILATVAHEMARRDATYALETLCIGGGQGIAAVLERVNY